MRSIETRLLAAMALITGLMFGAVVLLAQSPTAPEIVVVPKVLEPVVMQVQRLSDAAWVAIMGMVGTVVASIAGLFVALSTNKKVNHVSVQAAEIHTLTNANLTAANNARDAALAALKASQEMNVQLRMEKGDIAAAQTASDMRQALNTPPPSGTVR